MFENCDPLCPHQVWLPCVDHFPPESRPEFTFRGLSGRESQRLSKINDRIGAAGSTDAAIEEIYETCALGLLGWKNQIDKSINESVAFDPSRLRDVLNEYEARELIDARGTAMRLNAGQKKASASP